MLNLARYPGGLRAYEHRRVIGREGLAVAPENPISRGNPCPALDRALSVRLYRLWPNSLATLAIVKPETVMRWHRLWLRR